MNSFKNNHQRRGRYRSNGRSFKRTGNGHKLNGDFNNNLEFKRKNLVEIIKMQQLIEKYNDLAREALSNGDKILLKNYLQHQIISQEY